MNGDGPIWTEGDEVQLRSGGPIMTVSVVTDAGVECQWFDDRTLRTEVFRPATLRRYSLPTPISVGRRRGRWDAF